jgi:transposase
MDLVFMGNRDARRLGLVQAALQGKITNREGAEALGLSLRQFKRLRTRVRQAGPRGLIHGNRGRPSARRLGEATRLRIQELLTGAIKINDHHLAELVSEEGRPVSPASVRRERRRLKLAPKRRRRPARYYRRRERAARRGALVLVDASPFSWFADSVNYDLVGALDDATGEILALELRLNEDLHGYVTVLHRLIREHGVPLKLYGDRSAILVRNDAYWSLDEQLAGRQSPTQFGRMLEELAIGFVAATSPQAKGRIERMWGTLQDRLATELRLHGHQSVDAARAYLPDFIVRHNRRWACAPREPASAFRKAPPDVDRILACRYSRVIARDNTVSIPGRWVQIPPGTHRRAWHAARVEVRELLEGRLLVLHPRYGLIAEQPAPAGSFVLETRNTVRARQRRAQALPTSPPRPQPPARPKARARGIGTLTKIRRPRSDSPWKRFRYGNLESLRSKARAGG